MRLAVRDEMSLSLSSSFALHMSFVPPAALGASLRAVSRIGRYPPNDAALRLTSSNFLHAVHAVLQRQRRCRAPSCDGMPPEKPMVSLASVVLADLKKYRANARMGISVSEPVT